MVGRPKGIAKTGGRKKGTPNKASSARANAVAQSGQTPLDYMLGVMRDSGMPADVRLDAAKSAAPYVHPKLSAIEHKGGIGITHSVSDMTDDELAAIAAGSSAGTSAPSSRPH